MQACEKCGRKRFWTSTGRIIKNRREWLCDPEYRGKKLKGCGHLQLEERPQGTEHIPNILIYDIETSKTKVSLYPQRKPQFVRWDQIEAESYVMGWAAKWLFAPRVMSQYVTPEEAVNRDDARVITALHKQMDMADIVIGYNSDGFDNKEMNARWARIGLPVIQGYASIDLMKKVKQVFRLPSYSLAYVCKTFGLSDKLKRMDTDEAEAGDPKALKYDQKYCKHDVGITEDAYLFMRPHMKTHPTLTAMLDMYVPLEEDEQRCSRCTQVIHETKFTREYRTPSGNVHKSCRCPGCGSFVWLTKKAHKTGRVK